jgi:CheY-like chemotaxis protein
MSQQVQERLFEPFFTTKEAGKGTGLGLATVHGIVTRIGGSIGVYSELGRGSSFAIYLPQATSSDIAPTHTPATARAPAGGETVLVVDDAPSLRELTKRMLERQGYTVFLAANANEAIQVFESSAVIDVLLTDVIMPGGSGPELVAKLGATHPNLKVVYMSGYTDDAISQHGMLDQGIALLHKPFTAETLGAKLREALGTRPP